ncbi:MAG: sulfite exporter TauE/SafE family protein [Flavobacteriaceae bacterium]
MTEELQWLLITVVGFIAGFVNTLAGGGSIITLPAMILVGLDPTVANATNRLGIMLSALSAASGFKSKKVSVMPFSLYLGLAATIGAVIGAMIAVEFDKRLFNKVLAIIMIIIVVLMILQPRIQRAISVERLSGKPLWFTLMIFLLLGVYGGFINAGMGLLMILWLNLFNGLDLIRTNATKVLVTAIYTSAALAVFIWNDLIDWLIGLLLAFGNMVGGWIAARLSVKKGEGFIRAALLVMVILMAVKLWFF